MKISQVIKEMLVIQEAHGDLECVLYSANAGYTYPVEELIIKLDPYGEISGVELS